MAGAVETVRVNIIGIKIADQFIGAEKRVRDVNANRGIQFTRQGDGREKRVAGVLFPFGDILAVA